MRPAFLARPAPDRLRLAKVEQSYPAEDHLVAAWQAYGLQRGNPKVSAAPPRPRI